LKVCELCGEKYNEEFDFVEEVEVLEALDRYLEIEKLCPNCLYDIDERIADFVGKILKH
jgi:hypothetical protein